MDFVCQRICVFSAHNKKSEEETGKTFFPKKRQKTMKIDNSWLVIYSNMITEFSLQTAKWQKVFNFQFKTVEIYKILSEIENK